MYKPHELNFATNPSDEVDGAVDVFISTADPDAADNDNLRETNVSGLPEYFGSTDAENLWMIFDVPEDKIIADLIAAGFTQETE